MKKLNYLLIIIAVLLVSCENQPEASFYTDKVQAYTGEDIYFTNDSYNAVDFEWDFGDGTFSDAVDAVHSYSATGDYEVELSAWNRTGQVDKAYQTITIESPTILQIEVQDWDTEDPIAGIRVRLYPTLSDWDNETNMQVEGRTNANGRVIFTNLGPYVYFVDVGDEYSDWNNWDLRYYQPPNGLPVGYYIMTDQLINNEVNLFVGYADYVGGKGTLKRGEKPMTMKIRKAK